MPPTVSLVIPVDNSRWNAPASVTFQASVSSGEANDTVSVEFFANGVSQGVRSSAPWSVTTTLSAATYTITAVATDGQGASTTSAARTITVSDTNAPPTISISAPSGGANYPTAPASFTLNATANAGEVNGWVTKVEFYVNGALVNTDTAAPWSYNVSGLANGSYTLTAKAFDQLNATTTSAPVTVTVGPQPKLHFVQVDHLNTPRAIYDDQQRLEWKWEQQEPFGVNVPDENPSALGAFDFPVRFPGQYFDKETNLHYNYFRDFDPTAGRYIESDPLGLRVSLNTYTYVGGNALSLADPFGLAGRPAGIELLYEHLLEWAVEQGIIKASPWQVAGDACGSQICKSGGPRSNRSFNVEDFMTDLCLKGVGVGEADAAIEVLMKCRKRCEDYVKKNCPAPLSSCPVPERQL